jgi:HSP20 family protein
MVAIGFNPYQTRKCNMAATNQSDSQSRKFVHQPKSNIKKTENGFLIEVSVPGFEKKDISLQLEQNTLIVAGSLSTSEVENSNSFVPQTFERKFLLPDMIDKNTITATCTQGLLSIVLSNNENYKKSITIQ